MRTGVQFLLVACALVGAVASVGAAYAKGKSDASGSVEETWLLVSEAGVTFRSSGRPDLTLPTVAERTWIGAWTWSSSSPPTRISWDEVTSGEATPQPAVDSVKVDLSGVSREVLMAVQIRAAPLEMWREVPESELPTWSPSPEGTAFIPSAGTPKPWLLRAIGPGVGSWWVEKAPDQAEAALHLLPAEDLSFRVVDSAGVGVGGARVWVHEADADRLGRAQQFGVEVTDDQGRVHWPALPNLRAVRWILVAGGHVPSSVRGRPASLPREWRLDAGLELAGRIVGPDGESVPGATVELVTQPETFPSVWRLRTRTGPGGDWSLRGVPTGGVGALVDADGYGGFSRRLSLSGGKDGVVEMGEWELSRNVPVRVRVTDDHGVEVVGAVLRSEVERAVTDETGAAELQKVPLGQRYEFQVQAEGHLTNKAKLWPPHPELKEVVLPRALVVSGRIVDSEGAPLPEAQIRMIDCDFWEQSAVGPDGRFEVELLADTPYVMVLASPRTGSLRKVIEAGSAGERRDLGELVLDDGNVLRGYLVSAEDNSPLAQARVWMVRDAADPLTSWVQRDVVETRSGSQGDFELRGVPTFPADLRIEAPGKAPLRLDVQFPPGESELDLGEVKLSEGLDLTVRGEGFEAEGAVARIDLGGSWREMDTVEAPFREGVARFSGLPVGVYSLVGIQGETVHCRERITLEVSKEVSCAASGTVVSGQVTAGGNVVGPGVLSWLPWSRGTEPGIVIRRNSTLGIGRSSPFGEGLPQVEVMVGEDGGFSTNQLSPGRWRVVWRGDLQESAEPIEVEVPRRGEHELRIDLPGHRLEGWVTDASGASVVDARVRILESGTLTFSDETGGFAFVGLAPGMYHLQASKDGAESSVRSVTLSSDPAGSVDLKLGETEPQSSRVPLLVVDDEERPADGSLIVVELSDGKQRILTSTGDGTASLVLDPPWPDRLRAAAWTAEGWAVTSWVSWDRATEEGIRLQRGPVGGLALLGEERGPEIEILRSAQGWDFVGLLRRLGRTPRADREHRLVIHGLPSGVYVLGGKGVTARHVMVPEGRVERISLP